MLKAACLAGFQSCIITNPLADPGAVLEAVYPLLAPSASFAIFFHALQPLAECMSSLVVSPSAFLFLYFHCAVCGNPPPSPLPGALASLSGI